MKALVTGASSGIGLSIAKYLAEMGYDLILVARNKDGLEKIKDEFKVKVKLIVMDLSDEENAKSLYVLTKNENIDILINNAGFGDFGYFHDTDLKKELEMINLNVKTVHILTKLYLKDMIKRDSGYILNVASLAAFQPGPLMATYYSTKVYVLHLTEAIQYELKKQKSNVVVSCLCPGPVKTNFFNIAKVKFSISPLDSNYVAKCAIDQMFRKKKVIIPTFKHKFVRFMSRFFSRNFVISQAYNVQKKKTRTK